MTYDQFMAALCLWREGRGQSLSALTAIWWVILNRTRDPLNRWPKSITGVILQRAQFSSFSAGDPNSTKFPQAPIGATVAPSADWKAWLDCQTVVLNSLGGDPTSGATAYESEPVEARTQAWMDPEKITVEIGPFRFYKL